VEDGRFDRVRQVMQNPIDVDLPEGLAVAEDAAMGDSPGSFDSGWDGVNAGEPPAGGSGDGDDLPPEARCVDYPLNDYGNGLRLITHFGDDLRSVPRVGWYTWDERRWLLDPDGIEVRRKCHRLTELIAREIWHLPVPDDEAALLREDEEARDELMALAGKDVKERDAVDSARLAFLRALRADADRLREKREKSVGRRLTHAKNVGNTNAIKNLMTEGASIIAMPLEAMDAGALDINTESGVLRFSVVPGEDDGGQNPAPPVPVLSRLDHARDQHLTKLMPVVYDPAAACPTFIAFIKRIMPQAEMRRFLQRWFGLSMTALTGEQKFAFLYGAGANGKSVLVDLMAKLMGDYAASAKIESITGRNRRGGGDATPDLMPLIGARFVRASEPDQGQHLKEGLIKELTGGEPILVRALNENFVLVYPRFKLTISGNHKPEIHGGDDGIWRRVLLVPFDVQIPPDERDPDMINKLWAERSGILNWLIAGLLDYLAHGLQVPEQVTAATQEYREDSDPLASFLTVCCGVSGKTEHSIRAKDLSEAFALWMDEGGRGAWKPPTTVNRLKEKAGRWKHPSTGQVFQAVKSSESYYSGIELIEPFRTRFSEWKSQQASARFRGGNDAA